MDWTVEGIRAIIDADVSVDSWYLWLWTTAAATAASTVVSGLTGAECSGTGYARKALGTATVTPDGTGVLIDYANITYTAADFTDSAQVLIVDGNLTSDSIMAFGTLVVTPNGGDITLNVNAAGLLRIDA